MGYWYRRRYKRKKQTSPNPPLYFFGIRVADEMMLSILWLLFIYIIIAGYFLIASLLQQNTDIKNYKDQIFNNKQQLEQAQAQQHNLDTEKLVQEEKINSLMEKYKALAQARPMIQKLTETKAMKEIKAQQAIIEDNYQIFMQKYQAIEQNIKQYNLAIQDTQTKLQAIENNYWAPLWFYLSIPVSILVLLLLLPIFNVLANIIS